MPTKIPRLDIRALSESEREEGEHLSWLFGLLELYRTQFADALSLLNYCYAHPPDSQPSRWLLIALNHAALSLFHFGWILTGIGHSIRRCPTLKAQIDPAAFRAIKKEFSAYFPHHEAIRHAVGHAGEVQHTREKLAESQYDGTITFGDAEVRGFAGGSIVYGRTLYMPHKGNLAILDVSEESLSHIRIITDKVYNFFKPFCEKTY